MEKTDAGPGVGANQEIENNTEAVKKAPAVKKAAEAVKKAPARSDESDSDDDDDEEKKPKKNAGKTATPKKPRKTAAKKTATPKKKKALPLRGLPRKPDVAAEEEEQPAGPDQQVAEMAADAEEEDDRAIAQAAVGNADVEEQDAAEHGGVPLPAATLRGPRVVHSPNKTSSMTPVKARSTQTQPGKPNFMLMIKVLDEGSHALGNKIRSALKTRMNKLGWDPQEQQTSQLYWKRIDGAFGPDHARQLVSGVQSDLKERYSGDWQLVHILVKPITEVDVIVDFFGL